jgi:hypothetical protein
MKRIKEKYPDLDAVKHKFEKVLEGSFNDFLSSTHVRRQSVIGSRRYIFVSVAFVITMFLFLAYLFPLYGTVIGNILYGVGIIWIIIVLLSAREWLTNTRLLAKEVNMALVPILSNTLDRTVMYTYDTDHREETIDFLADSELITTKNITVEADDMFTIYGEREVTLRELLVTQHQKDSKGRETHLQIFKGVFVVSTLSLNHEAKTFISTDTDRVGFAHRTFWKNLFSHGEVQETVLEWNDFENHLHVATTQPVAARELLTPTFMQDLYDWWLEHKLNMRIAVHGDKFYMLLPEASIRLRTSTTSTDSKKIVRYAWTLVRPMWRSLVLLEDIS